MTPKGSYVQFERRIMPHPTFEAFELVYGIVRGNPDGGKRVRVEALDTRKRHVLVRANVRPVSFYEAHSLPEPEQAAA